MINSFINISRVFKGTNNKYKYISLKNRIINGIRFILLGIN